MSDLADRATSILYRSLNSLFAGHPQRTAYSVFLGLALNGFALLLNNFGSLSGNLPFLYYIAFAFVLLNLRSFYKLLRTDHPQDESVMKAIEMIERLKSAGAPQRQIREHYHELCNQLIQNANIDTDRPRSAGSSDPAENASKQINPGDTAKFS